MTLEEETATTQRLFSFSHISTLSPELRLLLFHLHLRLRFNAKLNKLKGTDRSRTLDCSRVSHQLAHQRRNIFLLSST